MKSHSGKLTAVLLLLFIVSSSLVLPVHAAVPGLGSADGRAQTQLFADPAKTPAAAAPSSATWKTVGSWLRLESSPGKYITGFTKYNGKYYYFNSYGNLLTGFFRYEKKTYYAYYTAGAKGKGQIASGLVKLSGNYYYFSPSSQPWPGAMATGFQTINGNRYYFDVDGRMKTGWFTVDGSKYYGTVSADKKSVGVLLTGKKKISGVSYSFDSTGKLISSPTSAANTSKTSSTSTTTASTTASKSSAQASSAYLRFIDVSEHQGTIDFKKVKASGVYGVIIRAGYGKSHTDKFFYQNIKKAQAAGLKVGIYWFSYAYTESMAKKEAEYCLKVIKKYKINLPVFYDWEYDSMRYAKEHMSSKSYRSVNWRSRITHMTKAFCQKIKNSGRRAGYYFNLHYLNTYYTPSSLKQYSTWYAYWGKNKAASNIWSNANSMSVPTSFDVWQFSSRGKVPGISGWVDCDLLLRRSILK